MIKKYLLQPVYGLLLLFSSSTYAADTPKDLFMQGFAKDQECVKVFQLMVLMDHFVNELWATENQPINPFNRFNTLIQSQLEGPLAIDPWTKEKLGSLSDHFFTLLGNAKDSTLHLTHALECYALDLKKNELRTTRDAADALYKEAHRQNKIDGQPYFEPATVFATTNASLDPTLCIIPAYMAEFGLFEVPKDAGLALMWYRRSAITNDPSRRFEVALRLMMTEGVLFSTPSGKKYLETFLPADYLLPSILPFVEEEFGRSTVFKTLVGSTFFGFGYAVLDALTSHSYPLTSTLLSLGISAGVTPYVENKVKTPTVLTRDEFKAAIKNFCNSCSTLHEPGSLSLLDMVKKLRLHPTLNMCRQLIDDSSITDYKIETVRRYMEGPQNIDKLSDSESETNKENDQKTNDNDDDDDGSEDEGSEDKQPSGEMKPVDSTADLPEIPVEPTEPIETPMLRVVADEGTQPTETTECIVEDEKGHDSDESSTEETDPSVMDPQQVEPAAIPRPGTPLPPSVVDALTGDKNTDDEPIASLSPADPTTEQATTGGVSETGAPKPERSMIDSFHLIERVTDTNT